ncbi:MAG: hypothetical protein ACRCZF_00245 [Gemmataceae bacterium]
MVTRLKLYQAPMLEDECDVVEEPEPRIRIRMGDLLPLVAMAQRQNFVWLKDFLDDEVVVTEDLHEVLMTFRGCRPRAS